MGADSALFIATPDFIISVIPITGVVLAGSSASYSVTVTSIFGFGGAISFSPLAVTGLPQGASASFSAASITPPANSTSSAITLTIATAAGLTGNYAFTVIGSSLGYNSHLGTSSLSIQDFNLTISPSVVTAANGQTATYQIAATGSNFSGPISISVSWPGASPCANINFSTQSINAGGSPATLTMVPQCGTPNTSYVFQIRGSGGGGARYFLAGLNLAAPVTPPSVSCSASPNPAATGQTVTFAASASGGTAPYSYSWSGPVSSGTQTASFVPTTPGTETALLTATDSAGRTASAACSVVVQQGSSALTITSSSTLPYGIVGSAWSYHRRPPASCRGALQRP